MLKIQDNLYQFSSYLEPINLSFHQYLIDTDEPILVHTGNIKQVESLLPEIKKVLVNKELKYIFVSHFESDECGGITRILKEYPNAKVICSQVTARQLEGFSILTNPLVKKPGEGMTIGGLQFEFISYPSEMHMWEGLLLYEINRGILFSSDLMISFGNLNTHIVESTLEKELKRIGREQIPDTEKRNILIEDLNKLNINFIATGHGQCIKII